MKTSFTFQSWNLWFGGSRVADGSAKIAAVAAQYPADVRVLQECNFERGHDLSRTLGYNHVQQGWDNAVSSKFPAEHVPTDTDPYAVASWVHTPGGRVLVWGVHLDHRDYGPYGVLRGDNAANVYAAPGEAGRLEQIEKVLAETERIVNGAEAASDVPVIIAGDFNCPSTHDWKHRQDRPDFAWPVVDAPLDAGFEDAFRQANPDVATAVGDTWSTIEPLSEEPRDRIDFVFVRGLTVLEAATIGNAPGGLAETSFINCAVGDRSIPEHPDNAYPSDHLIVQVEIEVS